MSLLKIEFCQQVGNSCTVRQPGCAIRVQLTLLDACWTGTHNFFNLSPGRNNYMAVPMVQTPAATPGNEQPTRLSIVLIRQSPSHDIAQVLENASLAVACHCVMTCRRRHKRSPATTSRVDDGWFFRKLPEVIPSCSEPMNDSEYENLSNVPKD